MSQLDNPLEIYKLLPKSNCRQCQAPTCLAFAAEVIKGQKPLGRCPHLEKEIIEKLNGKIVRQTNFEQHLEKTLALLKNKIRTVDFPSSAERLGAGLSNDKLTIKCLGKNFTVDAGGTITSDCHVNVWVTIPLLNYIISSAGVNASGRWVPFRELKNGMQFNPLFEQRCEKPLRQIADAHPDLFADMFYIFSGRQVTTGFDFDLSVILYPLPKLPILLCHSKPEDDLESRFNIFFDATAEDNLNIESIYMLFGGLVLMLQKIASRHG